MTLYEILEHDKIRSDRYALAAISHIFKAFGDPIRSKEYWPWGRDVQLEWYPSQGTNKDITEAELLLERARIKFEEEQTKDSNEFKKIRDNISMEDTFNKQIKELRRRINKAAKNYNNIIKTNDNIINVSNDVDSKIS